MQRPDLDTLACVNPTCQRFRLTGQDNLIVRTAYGPDPLRLLRCRRGGEEGSERRGTALCNPQGAEAQVGSVSTHLGTGGGGFAPPPAGATCPQTPARACAGWWAARPCGSMTN